jgi:hypothetical protein
MKATGASLPLGLCALFQSAYASQYAAGADQEALGLPIDPIKFKAACPDYKSYSMRQQYVNLLTTFNTVS